MTFAKKFEAKMYTKLADGSEQSLSFRLVAYRPLSTSFSNSSCTAFFFSQVTDLNPSRHATKFVFADETRILSTVLQF